MFLENTDEMESKGLTGPGRISLQALEKEQRGDTELPMGLSPLLLA